MRWLLTSLMLGLLALASEAQTIRYLNPATGSDSSTGVNPTNAPAGTGPWKTLNKVASSAGPGYVINIRGGSYTNAQFLASASSPPYNYFVWTPSMAKGTYGNPLVLRATPGETVTIDAQFNLNFISVESPTTETSFFLVIKDLHIRNLSSGGFSTVGFGPSTSDTGHAHYVAVVGCTLQDITPPGAAPLTAQTATHVIYKDNTLLNSGDTTLGGSNAQSQHSIYPTQGMEYLVMDGNYIEGNSGFGIHHYANHDPATDPPVQQVVIRRNIVVNGSYSGLITTGKPFTNTYIYNNTFYQETNPYPRSDTPVAMTRTIYDTHLGGQMIHTMILNNIGYGYADTGILYSTNTTARWLAPFVLDYNLWKNLQGATLTYSWDNVPYSMASFRLSFPYEVHSKEANPLFVNPGSPTRNFALQTSPTVSPAVDAGTTLTFATNASGGSGSTNLVVNDAGFFHDGYGMASPESGISGDTIQIGTTAPVVVTGVNYATNTLTLASARVWTVNTRVSLPYNGTAPDMGALESGAVVGPRTVFVSQAAPDDSASCDGGMSSPRKTTAGGIACLTPGSTLYYRAGTYSRIDSATMAIPGGTDWGNPTTIAAYGGESVTLATSTVSTSVIQLADALTNQYLVFDRLILDAQNTSGSYGLRLSGGVGNIRLQNSEVKNATVIGVYTPSSSGVELNANRLHHNNDGAGGGDGVHFASGFNNLATNNLIYANGSRGIVVGSGGSSANKVLANSVYGNGLRGINLVNGTGHVVRGNIAYGNAGTCPAGPVDICDETSGAGGTISTNLTTDPSWANPASGDFHLTFTSTAALNTGPVLAEVTTDFDGTVRGSPPDMGAYECSTACAGPPVPPSVSSRFPTPPYTTHFLAR